MYGMKTRGLPGTFAPTYTSSRGVKRQVGNLVHVVDPFVFAVTWLVWRLRLARYSTQSVIITCCSRRRSCS